MKHRYLLHKSIPTSLLQAISTLVIVLGISTAAVFGQQFKLNSGAYLKNTGATIVVNGKLDNAATISNSGSVGITVTGDLQNSGTLVAGSATHAVGGNWINTGTFTEGSSTVLLNGTSAQTISGSNSFNNLTISNTSGITVTANQTINAVLNLQSTNPSTTKGCMDLSSYTLSMGANATTVGIGEVTGIVKRTTINSGIVYSFGNQFTTIYFPNIGTLPSEMSAKISIGSAPSWRSGAIKRDVEFIQTGGSSTKAELSFHYLDTELNGNNDLQLTIWMNPSLEFGRSAYNTSDNFVSLSNFNIDVFSSSWGANKDISLDESDPASTLTWNGSVSTSWTNPGNWTPTLAPASDNNIIIPDASLTLNDPVLPSSTEIKTLTIESGGILNSDALSQLTLNGGSAWNNSGGTYNPNTSNVIFTNANATISGTTNFYDITIASGKELLMIYGTTMRIAGTITNNGVWRTVSGGNTTVEYNGSNQTVIIPDAATKWYYNLILSGSGTKTMPSTTLNIVGDFSMSGTAIATAAGAITTNGSFTIGSGNSFTTSTFSHSIGGNFINNGSFTANGSMITMNGSALQTLGGSTTTIFDTLSINNSNGVNLAANVNSNYELKLINGSLSLGANTLGINGTITTTSGSIIGGTSSNIIFGGSGATTILPAVLLNNLTVDRSNGISLGGAVKVNGTLSLTLGTLTLGANTLTISGNSPLRTTGSLNAGNASATLEFTNTSAIILPSSFFNGNVNNLILNGNGGVSLGSSITIANTLNLTNGILSTTSSNSLTLSNTASSAIIGGNTTSFISGPLTWNIPSSLSAGSSYVFPLGKDTSYLPMSVVDPTTSTGSITLTAEAFTASTGGSADGSSLASISTSEYWSLISTGNFTNSKISITRPASLPSNAVIGRSTSLSSVYSSIAGTTSGNSIINSNTCNGASQFFVVAQKLVKFTVSGSNNADGTYTSLSNTSGVFAAINATDQTAKNIIVTIDANSTAETGDSSLNAGSWKSLTIYPSATSLTISGNVNKPLINLNGADSVCIDGRLNQSGEPSLSITNTNTNTNSSASTLKFQNSAEFNTIKYCTIKGSSSNSLGGVLFFSTSASGNGNDANTIDHNNISSDDAGRPVNAIYSLGSTGFENSGNTISNNNIYDFFKQGSISNGINLSSFTTSWIISDNSFYETSSFAPTASVAYSAIQINNISGTGFIVSNNYIGGSSALCNGRWYKTAAYDNAFFAINLNVGASIASSIQNNTIKNFTWSNSGTASWTGIQVTVGAVNIGTSEGNSIGSADDTGSIYISGGANGANVYGIYISGSGTINIQNNIIGSITAANADNTYATNVYGIKRANTATGIISNNIIGSLSQANSIHASSGSTGNAQRVYGICNTTGGNVTFHNNTISNLTNATTNANNATSGLINGISSSYGVNTLTNNTISNLSISNANNYAADTASICGIVLTTTNALNTITSNTVCNLSNTSLSFDGSVIGLYFGSTGMYTSVSHTVTGNFIHSLFVTGASSTAASVYGIKINTGQTTYANNIISLGGNTSTSLYGIFETGTASNNNNLYFNTIYISGNPTSGILNSYALFSAASTNTRNFRNNIFENARSNNGASGKHYAAYFNYGVATNLSLDYNDYFAPGAGGVLGFYNSADVTTLPLISSKDDHSLTINPDTATVGAGTFSTNFFPSSSKLAGTTISTILTDYALVNRLGTPTMGALEGYLSLNLDVYIAGNYQSTYLHIKDAFDKINNGTHTGAIEIRIKASTLETASAVLYQSGYAAAGGISSYSSVTVYPIDTSITISGNFDAPLIDLNGADFVSFNGLLNQYPDSVSRKELTISNTSATTFASAIRFANSAENNMIRFCNIYSSCYNVGVGVINFTSSSTGNGNDNNIIEFCNISNAGGNRPICAIFTSGTLGRENSSNIIRYNNVYNTFNATSNSYGIIISSNSIDWTISDNSFYETTAFSPLGAYKYYPIYINTGTNVVFNNFIGGKAPFCTGSAMTINSNFAHYFCGIFINGETTNVSTIENNTIQNIAYTSTQSNPWDGIFINSGNIDVTGNTIGATTGTGSVIVNTPVASATAIITGGVVTNVILVGGGSGYTTAPIITFSQSGSTSSATATANLTNGVVTSITLNSGGAGYTSVPSVSFDGATYSTSHGMIQNSNGTVNITNNNIGSITTVGSSTYSHGFESVYVRGVTGTTTFTNNLIGSLTTANSIYVSSSAATSTQKQDIFGLFSSSIGSCIMIGNTIANLTNAYSGTNQGSKCRGIQTISGSNTIQNNIVRNITSASAQSGTRSSAMVVGISQSSTTTGTTQTLSGNIVYDLLNTHATAIVDIYGIYYSGPTSGNNTIFGNFIHSLNLSSSAITCEMDGIVLFGGLNNTSNNIINLGSGVTNGYKINGIWDESGATNNNSIFFNSIYIGGTVSSGTTSITAALYNKNNTSTRNYKDNILFNARSGGSTGKHYAILLAGTASLTINYNDYFVSGSGGILGKIGNFDKSDLTTWKAGTGQDVNSLNINPGYTIAGGTSALNYYTSAALAGLTVSGVTTDYSGLSRSTTPKMGALEDNNFTWQGNTSTDFGTASNWTGGSVPTFGANISFAPSPNNHCLLDQNRTLGNITNAQSFYKLVVNGYQLTINDSIIFTNSAQIDATANSSSVVFAGTAEQIIPSGVFVNNIVDTLCINNPMGVLLDDNFTVDQSLVLANGSFSIRSNTLNIYGSILTTLGTLNGGSSSNILINSSSASTTLPAVELNNLTLNRSNGIHLGGNVLVSDSLILTLGTLTIADNTLNIAGEICMTSGLIDASDAAATILFTNTNPITLPAAIFNGNVNNLTINAAGGITATSNFTVNGVLDLQSGNPSIVKGTLDMWDGSEMKTLIMGANAVTIGIGDVTGIVQRNSFVINIPYTFGNQFTTLTLSAGGTLPTSMSVKIVLSASNFYWKADAVHRYYDIIQTGGSSLTKITTNLHYLESELNGALEGSLNLFDFHKTSAIPHMDDHGHSSENTTDNWVSLANLSLTYVAKTSFDSKYWMLGTTTAVDYTWLGAAGTEWNNTANWVGGNIPSSADHVVIPDATTTPNDPDLPDSTSIGSIIIHSAGILNSSVGSKLIITGAAGAWDNLGIFNAGNSTVVFTNVAATMSDPTDFYNVTVADGAILTLGINNIMRIAGTLSLSNTGKLNAANNHNTIEYNGTADQTIVFPNGSTSGYHNLILSGSGTKTLPASTMTIAGDFTVAGTDTAIAAAALTIGGNVTIGNASKFITGNYNHSIIGNLENNGILTATTGNTITMNGTTPQIISGSEIIDFYGLTIDNMSGVTVLGNENETYLLNLSNGIFKLETMVFGINGGITKTNGFLDATSVSSLSFGGTTALILPDNLFTTSPVIHNLTINRSGGLTLGNQNMTVEGLLDLSAGTLNIAANTLTISGSSPVRTNGNINASNPSANLVFNNIDAIILPASIFSDTVNNLCISGIGGLTATSDFAVKGILNLQSVNPSATKGCLDMLDGSTIKTLTMGANATTIGVGDVTGIVTRTTIIPNIVYTFGNQYTTSYFSNIGTLPSQMSAKIRIGTAPSWRTGAINREIEIIQTGGSNTKATFVYHYLDNELNGNDEEHLVFWVGLSPTNYEYGRSSYNSFDKWISLSNVNVAFFSSNWDATKNITLDEYSSTSSLTWNGSESDSWTSPTNWTPNEGPSSNKIIIIPDASTTLYSPTLPSITEIKSLHIDAGGILNSDVASMLTINGSDAWVNNGGVFNESTSTIIFTADNATVSGITSFYNILIPETVDLWMTDACTMKIAGAITNNGNWHAVISGTTTVEYNGSAQTVTVPNQTTNRYDNLILSGSGIKTMPSAALKIMKNFTISGTASATALAVVNIMGNFTIGSGASFTTGAFIDTIGGNFSNSGSINTTGSTIVLNGVHSQTINGANSSTFNNFILNNTNGAILGNTETINGTLGFTNGKITLGANDLIMGSSAAITGNSNSNYIITNGAGALRQRVPATATDVIFPVGLPSGYLPLTIQLTLASTADDFKARVAEGLNTAYDNNDVATGTAITTNVVSKAWYLKENVDGGSNATVTVQWNNSDEASGFIRNSCNLAHYTSGAWNYSTSTAASGSSPYTQTKSGVSSFSPFGVFAQRISCSLIGTTFCAGSPITVNYTATGGSWNSGNVFKAQLSDTSGSFSAPVEIGSTTSISSGSISTNLPSVSTDGSAYRIRIVSDNPAAVGDSNGSSLTIKQLRKISGNINYYNPANTSLLPHSPNEIIVGLYQNDALVGSTYSSTNGSYTFDSVCPGDYEVRITSDIPTDGSVNGTDAAQVNYWGVNPYKIEKIRFFAGDVGTSGMNPDLSLTAIDAQRILNHFVNGTAFHNSWIFWSAGDSISVNTSPGESFPGIRLPIGSNLMNANMYGMCVGDFNRSFVPETAKSASSNLELVNSGNRWVGSNEEFELPLYTMDACNITATSLIIDFPANLVEVQDVIINTLAGSFDWAVNANQLRIGWYSAIPFNLAALDEVLTLKLKTTSAFVQGKSIQFVLAASPLNELTDAQCEVIGNAVLSIAKINATALEIKEFGNEYEFLLSNYPNPFNKYTMINYTLPFEGKVILEISNLLGETIQTLIDETQQQGEHSMKFNADDLKPGVYMANLRIMDKTHTLKKTIKLVNNR